ncbi:MAG: matrixin family metalloprotease, partial [Gemmatimonadales bacterium]
MLDGPPPRRQPAAGGLARRLPILLPMPRSILQVVTLFLLLLVLADRVADAVARLRPEDPLVQGASATSSATADLTVPKAVAVPGARRARLAARQQLTREAGGTYLDSLIISTDSVVRRWPDRWGKPIRVCIVEGGVAGYDPRMAGFVRDAFDRWEATGIGLRFAQVADTAEADIVVRWIDRFDFDRAGQTDLTWDQVGRVRHAAISLAINNNTGSAMPDRALLSVAVHEAGHALGLPHSADTNDVMFPATRTGTLTQRDQRTVAVLYRLPPGPVRDLLAER